MKYIWMCRGHKGASFALIIMSKYLKLTKLALPKITLMWQAKKPAS